MHLKHLLLLLVSSFLILASCHNTTEEKSQESTYIDNDYYEYKGVHLQQYALPAMIMVPDETADIGSSTEVEINHVENDFRWDLKIGEKFLIHMEDFGNNKNLVEAKKKELNNKDWFEINYLVNEKNIIVYEKKLKVKGINNASSKVGVEHVSYHVYAEQIIDGISYELRNSDDGNDKEMVRWIAKSIKSFKPLKTKQ
ncbi:MAG: hypothetical protein RIT10_83 [Bacteroidota bacterium]|jgi:hypothetical protein